MTAALVPVSTYPVSLLVASDGDLVGNATRVAVMQTYADAITYIRDRTLPAVGGLTIPAVLHEPASNGGPGSFVWAGTGWQETAGAGDIAVWPVALMPTRTGASVTWDLIRVFLYTINLTGHGGNPPAVEQEVKLDYSVASTGAVVNVVTFSDPAGAAALDAIHMFSSGALAHSLVDDVTYTLTYTGESGLNAQPDTLITGIFFIVEPTT